MTHVSSPQRFLDVLRAWWHRVFHRSHGAQDAAHEFEEFFSK
jgi:hypothetical protein